MSERSRSRAVAAAQRIARGLDALGVSPPLRLDAWQMIHRVLEEEFDEQDAQAQDAPKGDEQDALAHDAPEGRRDLPRDLATS